MSMKEHLSLGVEMLGEARGYISRGDVGQASEKLRKTAEEAINALALNRNEMIKT